MISLCAFVVLLLLRLFRLVFAYHIIARSCTRGVDGVVGDGSVVGVVICVGYMVCVSLLVLLVFVWCFCICVVGCFAHGLYIVIYIAAGIAVICGVGFICVALVLAIVGIARVYD